jgi:hypothetical protein
MTRAAIDEKLPANLTLFATRWVIELAATRSVTVESPVFMRVLGAQNWLGYSFPQTWLLGVHIGVERGVTPIRPLQRLRVLSR